MKNWKKEEIYRRESGMNGKKEIKLEGRKDLHDGMKKRRGNVKRKN